MFQPARMSSYEIHMPWFMHQSGIHTPGGMAEAAQTIVDYLRSKFSAIDVLVPTYAMSAGTMIALGCDRIIMGRQSQLGPTDPQLIVGNRPFSAHSIVEQFEEAKAEISGNPVLAHAWAPVLRSFGPALLQEARKSISYGQTLVRDWLQKYMFSGRKLASWPLSGDDSTASPSRIASRMTAQHSGMRWALLGYPPISRCKSPDLTPSER